MCLVNSTKISFDPMQKEHGSTFHLDKTNDKSSTNKTIIDAHSNDNYDSDDKKNNHHLGISTTEINRLLVPSEYMFQKQFFFC